MEGFGCYIRKSNTDETQTPNNAPATTAVGHRHTGELSNGGKKIC